MPTIKESELVGREGEPCGYCTDYEGAIWLCGEGYLCERCFATLAGIEEQDLFKDDVPLLDYEVPMEHKTNVRTKLMLVRNDE